MKRNASQSGLILLLVLWIMIVLTLLATAFYQLTSLEIQTSHNDMDKLQARLLADSALEFARAVLHEENDGTSDDMTGLWSGSGTLFQETTLGEGVFQIYTANLDAEEGGTRFGLRDEASKLNLNTATKEMLEKLPNVTGEMAAAIVDWRDPDNEETPGGAENEYYNNLTPSYDCGNKDFDRVAELLKVKGFSPEILYGEDINQDGVLQKAEDDGDENAPPDDADGTLNHGLIPYVTVYSYDRNVTNLGESRMNINSASEAQIRSRLEGKLKEQVIDSIVAFKKDRQIEDLVDFLRGDTAEAKKETGDQENKEGSRNRSNQTASDEKKGENESSEEEVSSASSGATLLSNEDFQVLLNEFTTRDEKILPGLVNVNTASYAVLLALPGMTEELAETIVNRKKSEAGGFTSVGELASLDGMTLDTFSKLLPHITVRSNVFEAQAIGYVPKRKAYAAIQAFIDRGGEGPVYRYYRIRR
ncbi:MAG: general secretion pathway protein GspK [Candidatus Omnitrophica bacterium]|nr:general secretion pathway protein GspK [Candidatus Omnitrophota bacterium]MCA9440995.1 general secretion pathway protein GspK [Candidatus Omnitrophota bacterium]